MSKRRYPQIEDGEWVRPTMKMHKEQCCDCGLIHKVEYEIVSVGKGKEGIRYRSSRDERATAAARNRLGIRVQHPRNSNWDG